MSSVPPSPFRPTPDVAALVHALLDTYERRGEAPRRAVRVRLDDVAGALPAYFSQLDPLPRTTANEQLCWLEARGLVRLAWQPGQAGHILDGVVLEPGLVEQVYAVVGREPLQRRRQNLRGLLLGERFRLEGWRLQAVQHCLERLQANKSPAPFRLDDDDWNRDLLAALVGLPAGDPGQEIPYRVFSVRLFNDSKRFDALKGAVARLARRHHAGWRGLSNEETLRELGLVANPGHVFLAGPWRLVDAYGQVISLSEFYPAVGIPAALAGRVQQATVEAGRVVCVENLTSFYELVQHEGADLAALCLWGNPAPAVRHLLRCLERDLPLRVPLQLWADVDCGGLGILAQLRQHVSPRFTPYRMDRPTLEAHAHWAHPLSAGDRRGLARLRRHPALGDTVPLIDYMLAREIKLEQEAVSTAPPS